uniref:Mitochondrial import receptor subunit TOM7 homolog n=1 Tax=Strongyloides venezuelensis TaxID=75913 RepID=A0A0K0ETV8_STRVS
MKLTENQKNMVNIAGTGIRLAVQYGFVPLVIYIGIRNGSDPLPNGEVVPISVMNLFWG